MMRRLLTVLTTIVREVFVLTSIATDAEKSIYVVLARSAVVANRIFIWFKKRLTLVNICAKENDGVFTLTTTQKGKPRQKLW